LWPAQRRGSNSSAHEVLVPNPAKGIPVTGEHRRSISPRGGCW
jgi:hypothetical protein